MSELVKVKVLRAHTNDRGNHVEGDEYETNPQHAKLLEDRNIVSTLGPVKAPPAEAKAEPAPANKAEEPPANKAEKPAPRGKATKSK